MSGTDSQEPKSPAIIDGPDALARLVGRLEELGTRRILLICAPRRRHVDSVLAALARFETAVYDDARVHVPGEVVERAAAALAESNADTIVTVGGGSAIGLGKALRLDHDVRFAAIPTTYSGSEMTSIHGITRDGQKVTGRADRVRPDLVAYDPALTASLPIALTVQSLLNALAQPVSALSAVSLDGYDRTGALHCAASLVRAIEDLLLWPTDLATRRRAQVAASRAGAVLDRGKMGVHHSLAHLLGGGLDLPHAALHSVLLPQTLADIGKHQPELLAELEEATRRRDLPAHVHDLLTRAGAPTSLQALGADAKAVGELARSRPELPGELLADAQYGLRPTVDRLVLGPEPAALLAGPAPAAARRVVVALHGRGAEAGGMVRRVRELIGDDPTTAIVGLRSGTDRWYATRYGAPGAGRDVEVEAALTRVDAALTELAETVSPDAMVLAGFSQGACLALEYVARNPGKVAAVVAPCGARIGPPAEWAPPVAGRHAGLQVLLGAATEDRWVEAAHIAATADWLRESGAAVELETSPGDRHDIAARLRVRARAVILNRPEPSGPTGFGNAITSEALAGAVPRQQNTPRLSPHGLYPEQINGTGFTAARAENLRTWCYRVRPSSQRRPFAPLDHATFGATFTDRPPAIDLTGFAPPPPPTEPTDFVDGLMTLGGAGSPALRRGWAVHLYACNRDMEQRAFYDADGDLLLLPHEGALTVLTELGPLEVAPGQLAILPRGIVFAVQLHDAQARGWVAEVYGRHFSLPERGLIGANGLADERHFRAPAAWYENRLAPGFRITAALGGSLHEATQDHSPFDVVGWHGNFAPWVYDFDDFSPSANARFDHGDPSVFSVLTTPLDESGAHLLDLIIFPARWDATHGTFRPPFFHRNAVFEFNGVIIQRPRPGSPFHSGVSFFTPPMTGHGVAGRTVERLRALDDYEADRTARLGVHSLWFQLESSLPMSLTPWAEAHRLPNWGATWGSHAAFFLPET